MNILVILLTILLFIVGILGTFVPALPGIGLVYLGILLFAFVDGFTSIQISTVVYLGIFTVLASCIQYASSLIAAKSAGGKKKALLGTFIGALIGSFMGPFGILVGAFMGALGGALLEGSTPHTALNVAFLSVIGILGGSLIQCILAIFLIIAFLLAITF